MQCTKISDIVQCRAASDVEVVRDCSVFSNILVLMAITEVPTKYFFFRASDQWNNVVLVGMLSQ